MACKCAHAFEPTYAASQTVRRRRKSPSGDVEPRRMNNTTARGQVGLAPYQGRQILALTVAHSKTDSFAVSPITEIVAWCSRASAYMMAFLLS